MSLQRFPKLGSVHHGPSIYSLLSWSSTKEYEYTIKNLKNLIKSKKQINENEDMTHFDEDKNDVIKLPDIFDGQRKTSKRLERYKRRREMEYEEVIERMNEQMEFKNIEVADKIRCQSDFIKNVIANVDDQMAHITLTTEYDKNKSLNITIIEFQEVCKKLHDLQITRRQKIHNYYNLLKEIENDRNVNIKRILRNTYQHLIKNSHKTPREIESFMERQMQKINAITMSNLRHYSDLMAHLLLVSENTTFKYLQQVQANKEKWIKYNATMAIIKLNKEKLQKNFKESFDKKASKLFENIDIINTDFSQTYFNLQVLYLTNEEYDEFEYQVKSYLDNISDQVQNIIGVFKLTINNTFNGYFESWENLKLCMIENGEVNEFDLGIIKSEYMMPAIESADKKLQIKLQLLTTNLISIQTKLRDKLDEALTYLKNYALAWETYNKNIEQASYLIILEMVLKIISDNKMMKASRVKLNTLLDDLRQAPTRYKLDVSLTIIIQFLDKMKEQWKSNANNEEAILYKYRNFVNNIIDVLINDLEEIIYSKSDDMEIISTQLRKRASRIANVENEEEQKEKIICHLEMKRCEYQVIALNNWRCGLRDIITNYIRTCREELLETAEAWINNIKTRNNTRIDIQLTYINLFSEEIKEDVYAVRKMEIRYHENILKRHIGGIQKTLNMLPECYETYEVKNKEIYERVKDDVKKLSEESLNVNKSANANICCLKLKQISKLYDDQVEMLKDDLNKNLEIVYYKIVKSGHKLRKSIKLFSEDGNFHSEEIKSFLTRLKVAEKKAAKDYRSFTNECKKNLKKYVVDFNKIYVEAERKLLEIYKELRMRDDTVAIIKRLQYEIRKRAYEFKYDYKKLLAFYKDFLQRCDQFLGKPDSLDDIKKLINDIVLQTENFYSKLLIPSDVFKESTRFISEFQNDVNNTNLPMYLYEVQPTTIENSFMSDVANKTYDTYNTLKTNAKEFYENKTNLICANKLKPTYDDFMAEIIDRFKYYHVQCEPLWIEQAKFFKRLITEFEAFVRKFKETFCDTFVQTQFNNGIQLQSNANRLIRGIKENNYKTFKKLHDQLKPLHGHPSNKHLLNEIDVKMGDELDALRTKIKEVTEPLKVEYRECSDHLHETFLRIEYELNNVVESLEYKKKYNTFLKQYDEKIAILSKLMREEKSTENVASVKLSRSDVCEQMVNKLEVDPCPSTDNLTVSSNPSSIWDAMLAYNNNNKCIETGNKNVADLIKEYDESLNKFVHDVDMIEENSQKELDEWHRLWRMDIDRVRKLYSVKYEIRNESNE